MQTGITSLVTPLTNAQFQLTRPTLAGWQLAGGSLTVLHRISGKAAMATLPMAVSTGRSRAYWKTTFSAATPTRTRMRRAPSSTSAFFRHFVTTFIAQSTAGNPGQSFRPTDWRVEAIRSGLLSIRLAARGTGSSINLGTRLLAAAAANSAGPRMAGSPGRLPSLFLTQL